MKQPEPPILLQAGRQTVIAHRGNSRFAPENTLLAFSEGVQLGADALELDVHLSRDGEAVVIHDDTVDRTTDGKGSVGAMALQQLQALNAGARFTTDGGRTFPHSRSGASIPTLLEVLRFFPSTPVVIEIKAAAAQNRVAEIIELVGCASRVVVASFELDSLQIPREVGLATGAARTEQRMLYMSALLGLRNTPPAYNAVFAPRKQGRFTLPATPFVWGASRFGLPVHTWVENHPETAKRLWRAGVTGIITDDPGLIVQARASG